MNPQKNNELINSQNEIDKDFSVLLEQNLDQLINSSLIHPLRKETEVNFYREFLVSYFRSDSESMEQSLLSFGRELTSSHSNGRPSLRIEAIAKLSELRLSIRKNTLALKQIEELQSYQNKINLLYDGEIKMVSGLALEKLQLYQAAYESYRESACLFKAMGLLKRSLRAQFNTVTAASKVHPQKRFIVDYHHIMDQASSLGISDLAGICANNISREYQMLGALGPALTYANQAVEVLRKSFFGSVNYYLALTHRCHIYLNMENWKKAFSDYEEALISPFPEIHASLEALNVFMNPFESKDHLDQPHIQNHLTFSWRERIQGFKNNYSENKLTDLEERLVYILSQCPHSYDELMEALYEEQSDFDSKYARLRVLLARVRKKLPGVIDLVSGKYQLTLNEPELDRFGIL